MSDLKVEVMNGLKWSILAKILTQGFSWVSTFLVIRMLSPSDYGIIAIAMIFFGLIELFTSGGLMAGLIKKQDVCRVSSNQVFTFSIIVNLSLSFLVFIFSQSIADAYDNQALVNVLLVLAVLNPLSSLLVVPTAHLQMKMRFKEKAIAESLSGFVGAITAFACAYYGQGYWSLVYAIVTMNVTKIFGVNFFARSRYSMTTQFKGAYPLLSYSLQIQLAGFLWFLYNKADTVIIGRLLGLEKLGVYNIASEVASIPMSKINSILNEVGFAAFTRAGGEEEATRLLSKALKLMAVVVFPVFFGLSAVSQDLIDVVLGDKWAEAGSVIAVLALIIPFRMMASVYGNFSMGMGRANFNLINTATICVILIVSIYFGSQYGLMGAAWSWVIGFLLAYAFIMVRFGLSFSIKLPVLFCFIPSLLISSLMYSVIYFVDLYCISALGLPLFASFSIKIMLGVVVAAPLMFILNGREIIALLKK